MNRKLLLIVVALVSASAAHAQSAGRLSFTGSVVQGACNPAQPLNSLHGGMGGCGTGPARAAYAEQTARAQSSTGVAMLDYFVDRPDGGAKYVVTREYL